MVDKKYEYLIDKIPELVGGESNVSYFTHCVTRLRLNIKDKGLVDLDGINKVAGVIGSQFSGEQLQIIIGPNVKKVYEAINQVHNFNSESKTNKSSLNNDQKTKKKFNVRDVFSTIVACLSPAFPLLTGASLLRVICIISEASGILSAESTTYLILSSVADAGFYFLPIYIGANAAKRFGSNQGIGMLMGGMLLHPSITAAFQSGEPLNIFGLPVFTENVYYMNAIIPPILIVLVASYVEKFFEKRMPKILNSMLTPLFTILVMVPLAFVIIGPLATIIGTALSSGLIFVNNHLGFLAVGLLAAVQPWLVSTGLHSGILTPYVLIAFSSIGFDTLAMPAAIIMNCNMAAAAFAVAIKTKDMDLKGLATSGGVSAAVAGISEPVLFGVALKLMKPMYAIMAGGLVAGCLAGLMKVASYSMGGVGLIGIITFLPGGSSNVMWMLISAIIGMIITFVATMVIYKKQPVNKI